MPTHANGQLAIGCYTWDDDEQAFLPFCVDVLTLQGERIKEVTAFVARATPGPEREIYARWTEQPLDPRRVAAAFERFGLPERLE